MKQKYKQVLALLIFILSTQLFAFSGENTLGTINNLLSPEQSEIYFLREPGEKLTIVGSYREPFVDVNHPDYQAPIIKLKVDRFVKCKPNGSNTLSINSNKSFELNLICKLLTVPDRCPVARILDSAGDVSIMHKCFDRVMVNAEVTISTTTPTKRRFFGYGWDIDCATDACVRIKSQKIRNTDIKGFYNMDNSGTSPASFEYQFGIRDNRNDINVQLDSLMAKLDKELN